MRVFVSLDIEGISGVVHWDQCSPGNRQYDETRALMTGEANAAISGAFDGGASEVVVNDAHAMQRNISPLELDRRARLITGDTKPLTMMQGIDQSFDAAFLVGYHAGAGRHGVLSHTYASAVWSVKLNSQPAGEITISAALAGYYGVPIAVVTGDSIACEEAESAVPGVETVPVKEPITRYSANCCHPLEVRERIRAAALAAMGRMSELKPLAVDTPVRFELTFAHPGHADCAGLMPEARRVDPVTVAYESDDFITAYRAFLTMLVLARSAA